MGKNACMFKYHKSFLDGWKDFEDHENCITSMQFTQNAQILNKSFDIIIDLTEVIAEMISIYKDC